MVDLKSEVAVAVNKEDNGNAIDFKMVTFILAGKEYGVEIMNVKEIQKGSRFTFVPNAPPYVRGVYNLRGDIIPVIDLRRFFEIPGEKEKSVLEDILILREKGTAVGVIVDSIQKVVGVSSKDIQPSHPLFSDVVGLDYIYGVVEKDKYLYVILDTSVILSGGKTKKEKLEELEQGFIVEDNVKTQKNVVTPDILQEQEVSVVQEPLQSQKSSKEEKNFQKQEVSVVQEPLQSQESSKEEKNFQKQEVSVVQEPLQSQESSKEEKNFQKQEVSVVQEPLQSQEGSKEEKNFQKQEVSVVQEPLQSQESSKEEKNFQKQEVSVVQEPLQSQEGSKEEKNFQKQEVSVVQEPLQSQERLINNDNLDLKETIPDSFLEELFKHKGFCASELNEEWLQSCYNQWISKNGDQSISTEYEDIVTFFSSFYSLCSKELWEDQLLDEFYRLISDFPDRTIHIWDVNCGLGFSTYSIAGGFFLRDQPCKIYATDSNLEVIMSASGMIFEEDSISNDLKLAMVEGKQGWQFSNEVKNRIIFEYHNLSNGHIFPRLDVIIARDVLSFVNEEEYMKFFEKIDQQVNEGCLLIVGDNEVIKGREDWIHVPSNYFSVYKKGF